MSPASSVQRVEDWLDAFSSKRKPDPMMCVSKIAVVSLSLVVFAAAATAQAPPEPFSANYIGRERILLFNVTADATLTLERVGDYLKYTSAIELRWTLMRRSFFDCSIMHIDDGKFYPLIYRHIDRTDEAMNVTTEYDWANGVATTIRGDRPEPRTADLSWPTWDPMSVQVAIMALAPTVTPGDVETHRMLERGRLAEYRLQFNGEATTDTLLDDIDLVEVVSEKADDDGSGTLWLAPAFNWVPAKIRINDVVLHLRAPPQPVTTNTTDGGATPQC